MLLFALACKSPTPTDTDGVEPELAIVTDPGTWAGAAVVDITPEGFETFTDENGDNLWFGCLDGTCGEPFDDANGNGLFDPTWIGGFAPLRPALEIHDPISARAAIISHEGDYLVFVGLDLVGLSSPRIDAAREALEAQGMDGTRLIVASSHNHDGPDTMGLWGNPLLGVTGRDLAYQERITEAIVEAVIEASKVMTEAELSVGSVDMRDRGPWFNGSSFGGKNPDTRMHGMIHDGRDPVVVSDQLLVIQANQSDGTVFTMTNWSGHPEVRGSSNNAISADWVGVTRDVLEDHYGGIALHVPESLGGMQSALGGDLPLVQTDGTHVYQTCNEPEISEADHDCFGAAPGSVRVDGDGDEVPQWADRNSWDFVTSHGWHIAEAAIDALLQGESFTPDPIRAEHQPVFIPVENRAYLEFGPQGLFDIDFDDLRTDPSVCPEAAPGIDEGCIQTTTARVQLGPIGFATVPGELLPELARGLPDDPVFDTESADLAARGGNARYFPQHPRSCDDVDYTECRLVSSVDDCDCYRMHAQPYSIAYEPQTPLLDRFDSDVRYRAIIGMSNDYLSYIIPEPDFNRDVYLLGGEDGDHYEDTVSPASNFATRLLEAHDTIDDRW